MPAAAIFMGYLGASGALTAIGASIAGVAGLSVAAAGVTASIAASTISAAAATAIGAGAISAGITAVTGGSASDVLKSAVLGGVTSYAGSAIASSVASSVTESILSSGSESLVSKSIAESMGRVAGSAVSGGVTSGTRALLEGQDPIEALLKGGVTGALTSTVAESVDYALKDVPGFGKPANANEAALQRSVKAAIGTAILTGGDQAQISSALVNSYINTMAATAGRAKFNDNSNNVRQANEAYKTSQSLLEDNLSKQQQLAADYNKQIEPIQTLYAKIQDDSKTYDDLANKFNNFDSIFKAVDVTEVVPVEYGSWGADSAPHTVMEERTRTVFVDENGKQVSKEDIYNQAMALNSQLEKDVADYKDKNVQLLGGEVTKYRTETRTRPVTYFDEMGQHNYEESYEVEVPYTETVVGSATPIKGELDALQSDYTNISQQFEESKNKLTDEVNKFYAAELENADATKAELDKFANASKQYKDEFGVDPTQEQLTQLAATGDILGAVNKLVAENNNKQAVDAGYKNYDDYKTAGGDRGSLGLFGRRSLVSAEDFYARQEGWQNAAQKIEAEKSGFDDPTSWAIHSDEAKRDDVAKSAGFPNYATQQSFAGDIGAYREAQNEIMAKNAYFPDFYTFKQFNGDLGLYQHFTRNEDAKSAGFPDFATQIAFGGDRDAYEKSIIKPAEAPGLGDIANIIGLPGREVAGPMEVMADIQLPYLADNLPKGYVIPPGFRVISMEDLKDDNGNPISMREARETKGVVETDADEQGRTALVIPDKSTTVEVQPGDVASGAGTAVVTAPDGSQLVFDQDNNLIDIIGTPDQDIYSPTDIDANITGGGGSKPTSGVDTGGGDILDGGNTFDGGLSLEIDPDQYRPLLLNPQDENVFVDPGFMGPISPVVTSPPGDIIEPDGGVSTDTSLPRDPVDGEDGTSDFGDVVVPEEGGVSTDTSLPTDDEPTDEQEPVEEEDTDTTETEECPEGYVRNLTTGACELIDTGEDEEKDERDQECPEGYVRNLETGVCELVEDTDEPDPCGEGYHWDESRQICVPDSDEEEDEECPEGYARNLGTGECELIEEERPQDCGEGYHWDEDRQLCIPDSDEEEDDECPEGYIRNLNTGECIRITTTDSGKGVVTTPTTTPPPGITPNLGFPFFIPEPPIVTSPSISDDPVMKGALPEMPQETKFQGPLDQFLKIATGDSFNPKPPQPQQAQQQAGSMNDRLSYPQGGSDYFSYGQQSDIENNLSAQFGQAPTEPPMEGALQFKQGGMATPMMAGGGTTRYGQYAGGGLNVINHSGKQRLDFRKGAAVSGPGDGQSDDIPAMLADGEFVFPADVVAALGNGSTKAGSDKLYDMMHSIRAYHRSAKPKDLPPPAKKSPLDYLKKAKKARS